MKTTLPVLPSGAPAFHGPGLSRRAFVELGAGGLVASWFLPSSRAAWAAQSAGVTPRGSARNCLFVFLPGAPSQVDTWDLKEGAWTPPDFAPTSYEGGLRFPQGLLPKLAGALPDLAIVRSLKASALVHGLGQTWVQIARNPTGATGSIAPHLGAVSALELAPGRSDRDVLPGFLALNAGGGLVGSGYLPSTFSPFAVSPTATGLPSLTHPDGSARFAFRWSDLERLDGALRSGESLGKDASDAAAFYAQAKVLMDSPDVNALFAFSESDGARYGTSAFGNACLVAKQVLAGNRGARFVEVSLGGWDMHSGIYDRQAATNLYTVGQQLDDGLAALISDLRSTPGAAAGGSLLDETLVVVAGEFGRTVGNLNGQSGRDHYAVHSVVFAGGGVRGGRVLGATDAAGATVVDGGMPGRSELRAEDVACTIYSALGIDWTTVRHDDPLGRGFEYVPYAKEGVYAPIDALF
jgi:hypothetical protein